MREEGPFVLTDMHGEAQPGWRAFLIGDEEEGLLSVRRGRLMEVVVDPVQFEVGADGGRVALTSDVRASLQASTADPQRIVRWLAELRPLLAVPEVVLAVPEAGSCRSRLVPAISRGSHASAPCRSPGRSRSHWYPR